MVISGHMCSQLYFLICCIRTIFARKWFFASMNSDMSDNVTFWCTLFVTIGTNKRFWARFVKLQNKYFKIDQNLLKTLKRFHCFIVISDDMCIQISFLCAGILAISAWKWFLACMYSDMSDNVSVTCKLFFTSRASIRSWAKFVRVLQNKYFKIDQNLFNSLRF